MTDKRELIQAQMQGMYAGANLPAPMTRDERKIAQKADNASYAVQAAAAVHGQAMHAAAELRTYATGVYAGAAQRMVNIQNSVGNGEAREYVEPFVMKQAVSLAHDLDGLGNAAVGNMTRTAAQNYLPEPKKGLFGR